MALTDEKLMQGVKSGTLDMAADLFDRHNKRLYNFFVKSTGDRDSSADLVQNTFMRMIKYKHTYNGHKAFLSWFYQIARNVCADHFRKQKMKYAEDAETERIVDRSLNREEEIVESEMYQRLNKSLLMLNEDSRQVLIMARYQKMKYERIAEVLDSSVPAVKVKVHRAIKKLKEYYFELEKAE